MENKEKLIKRPEYISKLNLWRNQEDLVKIITGVRRCGKSKLFVLFQQELLKDKNITKKQIINISLEDITQIQKAGLKIEKQNCLTGFENLLEFILKKIVPNN